MPVRLLTRDQAWLLPPTLEDLVPPDHPVRFVAAFVDGLDRAAWQALGVAPDGEAVGAPAYAPRLLLAVWVYGFMTGVRSSRRLEVACRDQVPYWWLTGRQLPDHTTLWRFYRAHRRAMRQLLRRTIRVAVAAGLVALAVQALDGTKVQANAAKDRSYDAAGLTALPARTEAAIADLEAQNTTGGVPPPARLPKALAAARALRARVATAQAAVAAEDGPATTNLTDPDAGFVKGRQGVVVGYNAQAMVTPLDPDAAEGTGVLIMAADLTTDPDDHAAFAPMLDQATAQAGRAATTTLADGGYHSGPNLAAAETRQQRVLMPESQDRALAGPYHKDRFTYDAATDAYTCPLGQVLASHGVKRRTGRPEMRVYRASGTVCRACPAFGTCTSNRRWGRSLEIGPYEPELRRHRATMATAAAKAAYGRRKTLIEPVFGILKEQQGARRFLLRGWSNVWAEWQALAAAFNLRTLAAVWQRRVRAGGDTTALLAALAA